MTDEPGPGIAELRAELAALRADLAALARHIGGLQARLPTTNAPTTSAPAPAAPATNGPPQSWAQQAGPEAWADLLEWVAWLHETYDLSPARAVLPCWPAHPGAVEELAALHASWQQAATAGADAAITWHERRLHPTLTRLRENYQLLGCTETHRNPRPARPTDPQLLDAAAAGNESTGPSETAPA